MAAAGADGWSLTPTRPRRPRARCPLGRAPVALPSRRAPVRHGWRVPRVTASPLSSSPPPSRAVPRRVARSAPPRPQGGVPPPDARTFPRSERERFHRTVSPPPRFPGCRHRRRPVFRGVRAAAGVRPPRLCADTRTGGSRTTAAPHTVASPTTVPTRIRPRRGKTLRVEPETPRRRKGTVTPGTRRVAAATARRDGANHRKPDRSSRTFEPSEAHRHPLTCLLCVNL